MRICMRILDRMAWAAVTLMAANAVGAADIPLEKLQVVAKDDEFQTPAEVLVEEVSRRTGVAWAVSRDDVTSGAVVFRTSDGIAGFGPEQFDIATTTQTAAPRITITAAGQRG